MEAFVTRKSMDASPLWQTRAPRLQALDMELTERCDNACQHCYINLPQDDRAALQTELTTAEWKRILAEAAALGVLSVRFTGGEPLLRADFAELYEFARRQGLKVTIFTNGRNITPELVALFRRIPPLEKIEITVYGMSAESYDAVSCAPGAFAQMRRGVDLLLEGGVPFLVKTVRLPQNQQEMEAFQTWAATIPGMELPASMGGLLDLRARRDAPARQARIIQLRAAPEDVARSRLALDGFREDVLRLATDVETKENALLPCSAGVCALPCVDAYGQMQACMLLRAPGMVYDLRASSMADALAYFFPRLGQMKNENPAYLQRCGRCFLRSVCEQCAAKAWMETGIMDMPVEYQCQVTHAIARQIGLLAAGEVSWNVTDSEERIQRCMGENG